MGGEARRRGPVRGPGGGNLLARHRLRPRIGEVYVANFGSASLSIIDPKTKRVVKTTPLDGTPVGVATDPRSGNVCVTRGNVVDVFTPLRRQP